MKTRSHKGWIGNGAEILASPSRHLHCGPQHVSEVEFTLGTDEGTITRANTEL